MNTFVDAVRGNAERVRTENDGATFDSSVNSVVDLFFTIGALRGQGTDRLYRLFAKAAGQNPVLAARVALWARDVRGGAGERQIFRDLLVWLETNDRDLLRAMLPRVVDLGRWDDLLVFKTAEFKTTAFRMIAAGLAEGNGLCAKWMPRKGTLANDLRRFLNLTPKQYRKLLVNNTNVVETAMCAKNWEDINYSHLPSLAQSRYNKAFYRHDEVRYSAFMERAAKGEEKVNAGAVYPYDVLKLVVEHAHGYSWNEADAPYEPNTVRALWNALPNFMGDSNVMPLVDVSGSMTSPCGGNLTCLEVSVSLGLYMATKCNGPFHNMFMTFTGQPEFVKLNGEDIIKHVQQMNDVEWGMNTNVYAALEKIAAFGHSHIVRQFDMPKTLVILSDMEFDRHGDGVGHGFAGWGRSEKAVSTTYEAAVEIFKRYGYDVPNIVWWNIQSRQDNVPVRFDQNGTALVSGFSPAMVKNILAGENITPIEIMLKTILDPRYDLVTA